MADRDEPPGQDRGVPGEDRGDDDIEAIAGQADAIMEDLARSLDRGGPGVQEALRTAESGLGGLAKRAARLAGAEWLIAALTGERGRIRLELWDYFGYPVDLKVACRLLRRSVESAAEPDADYVFSLVRALSSGLGKKPSHSDRDALITWGSWLLARPRGEDGEPDGYYLNLREQIAMLLDERAMSGDHDRGADLDAEIWHLERLVAGTPAGQDRTERLALLVSACWDRIGGDFSQEELVDRLVRHASAAWTAVPALPDDVRVTVGLCLGTGIGAQITRPAWQPDVSVLDLGIGVLSEILPDMLDEPGVSAAIDPLLGMMLVGRGQVLGNTADLAAAEPYLLRAASTLPVGDPAWSDVVFSLAGTQTVLAASGFGLAHSDQALRLLRAAAEHPPADPEMAAMIQLCLGCVLLGRTAGRRGPDADEGIERLTAAFEMLPPASPTRLAIAWNLCAALIARFFDTGDRQVLQAAQFYFDLTTEVGSPHWAGELAGLFPSPGLMFAAVRGQLAVARAMSGDSAASGEAVETLRAAVRLAGPDHPLAFQLRSDLGTALLVRYGRGGGDRADLREAVAMLREVAEHVPGGHLMRDIILFRAGFASLVLAMTTRDVRPLRDGIASMTEARATWRGGAGDPLRVTAALAIMHAELYQMSGVAADLAAAREWFATAAAEFEQQPGHPQHGALLSRLARLEHQAGAEQAAVRAGLAALRARARDVLLQTGPMHGLVAARTAVTEAAEIAGWCLEYGATEAAVEALELGRGLVLHAATSVADMPELLAGAGREDLAAEWRRLPARPEPGEPWGGVPDQGQLRALLDGDSIAVPSGLRERTLAALGDTLVTPPGHREIAGALTRTGADALVYLLPPSDGTGIRVLVVPADSGTPREVPLPPLPPQVSDPLDEYEAAQASLLEPMPADGGAASGHAVARWRGKLDLVSDWAWNAVVGPLLDKVPRDPAAGAPRLVLVPVGRLGVIPWHAARRALPDGGGWRYAIADAVFSYAASGRQLCEVSRRPAAPLTDDPVIVAVRESLLICGMEAASALRARYPGARFLGFALDGPVEGPAMPRDVLGVLPARDRPGASMLHLLCHGLVTNGGVDASYLELDAGRPLTVDTILRQANGRPAAAPGGLVELAACRTDVTAADYDEALTLATSFLAAGPVTVVGSRWAIPDGPSAAMSSMFHEFLSQGCSPRDALRQAQLWMLDPGRIVPAGMPAMIRALLDGAMSASLPDIEAWAGMTHQGR